MAYGSIMSISNDSSEFNNAILKITGPKAGSTVNCTQGSIVINAIEDNGVWTAEVGKGSWVVKSGNRSTTVQIELGKVYEVVLKMIGTLNETSWEEISQLSASGEAADYWAIGDFKTVQLNGKIGRQSYTNYNIQVSILEFNHNIAHESKGITFSFGSGTYRQAFADDYYNRSGGRSTIYRIRYTGTNDRGWVLTDNRSILGSASKTALTDTLMGALPNELRSVMKSLNIWTDNTGNGNNTSSYVTQSTDYLPLLAEYEVFGVRTYANSRERSYQKQYNYYASGNSKIKLAVTGDDYLDINGSPVIWTLRSPAVDTGQVSYKCIGVSASGSETPIEINYSYGLAPIFRV